MSGLLIAGLQVKWPNQQCHGTEGWRWSSRSGFNPSQDYTTMLQ